MFFAAIGEVIPIFFIKPLILNVSSSEVVDDFLLINFILISIVKQKL